MALSASLWWENSGASGVITSGLGGWAMVNGIGILRGYWDAHGVTSCVSRTSEVLGGFSSLVTEGYY